jgi:hypothetical protein
MSIWLLKPDVDKRSLWRPQSGRGVMLEVIPTPEPPAPQDDEEVVSEVHLVGDVAGWTCIASSFVGHKNICKS